MTQPTQTEKKIATEILNLLAGFGEKIEAEFPGQKGVIPNLFIICALCRVANEHGPDGALCLLESFMDKLRDGSLVLGFADQDTDPPPGSLLA